MADNLIAGLTDTQRSAVEDSIRAAILERFPGFNNSLDLRSRWPKPKPAKHVVWSLIHTPLNAIEQDRELFLSLPDVLKESVDKLYGEILAERYYALKNANGHLTGNDGDKLLEDGEEAGQAQSSDTILELSKKLAAHARDAGDGPLDASTVGDICAKIDELILSQPRQITWEAVNQIALLLTHNNLAKNAFPLITTFTNLTSDLLESETKPSPSILKNLIETWEKLRHGEGIGADKHFERFVSYHVKAFEEKGIPLSLDHERDQEEPARDLLEHEPAAEAATPSEPLEVIHPAAALPPSPPADAEAQLPASSDAELLDLFGKAVVETAQKIFAGIAEHLNRPDHTAIVSETTQGVIAGIKPELEELFQRLRQDLKPEPADIKGLFRDTMREMMPELADMVAARLRKEQLQLAEKIAANTNISQAERVATPSHSSAKPRRRNSIAFKDVPFISNYLPELLDVWQKHSPPILTHADLTGYLVTNAMFFPSDASNLGKDIIAGEIFNKRKREVIVINRIIKIANSFGLSPEIAFAKAIAYEEQRRGIRPSADSAHTLKIADDAQLPTAANATLERAQRSPRILRESAFLNELMPEFLQTLENESPPILTRGDLARHLEKKFLFGALEASEVGFDLASGDIFVDDAAGIIVRKNCLDVVDLLGLDPDMAFARAIAAEAQKRGIPEPSTAAETEATATPRAPEEFFTPAVYRSIVAMFSEERLTPAEIVDRLLDEHDQLISEEEVIQRINMVRLGKVSTDPYVIAQTRHFESSLEAELRVAADRAANAPPAEQAPIERVTEEFWNGKTWREILDWQEAGMNALQIKEQIFLTYNLHVTTKEIRHQFYKLKQGHIIADLPAAPAETARQPDLTPAASTDETWTETAGEEGELLVDEGDQQLPSAEENAVLARAIAAAKPATSDRPEDQPFLSLLTRNGFESFEHLAYACQKPVHLRASGKEFVRLFTHVSNNYKEINAENLYLDEHNRVSYLPPPMPDHLRNAQPTAGTTVSPATRGRLLETYPFLVNETPALLAALKNKGIISRPQLEKELKKKGITYPSVYFPKFANGLVLDTRNGKLNFTVAAKAVAEIAGIVPEVAYAKQLAAYKASAPKAATNTGAPKTAPAASNIFHRAAGSTAKRPSQNFGNPQPLTDFPIFTVELPELLAALQQKNIRLHSDLVRALVEEKGMKDSNADLQFKAFCEGAILNKNATITLKFNKIAEHIAEIAGLTMEEAYARQIARLTPVNGNGHAKDAEEIVQQFRAVGDETAVRKQLAASRTGRSPHLVEYPFARVHLYPLISAAKENQITTIEDAAVKLNYIGFGRYIGDIESLLDGRLEIFENHRPDNLTVTPAAAAIAGALGLHPQAAYEAIPNNTRVKNLARAGEVFNSIPIDREQIFADLCEAYPSLRAAGNLDGLYEKARHLWSDRPAFDRELKILAENREPHDIFRRDLKPIAKTLQLTVPEAGLFEDLSTQLSPQRQLSGFGGLLQKTFRTPVTNVFRQKLDTVLSKNKLKQYLEFLPHYVALFNGRTSPAENGRLNPYAAQLMDILGLSSLQMVMAAPELSGILIYSDLVRRHFPNLAHAMRYHDIYTMADVKSMEGGKNITPDAARNLLIEINKSDDAVFRCSDSSTLLAGLLKIEKELLLSDEPVRMRGMPIRDKLGASHPHPAPR